MTLYFGCRKDAVDNIYKQEIRTAVGDGVLHQYHLALSRDKGPKVCTFTSSSSELDLNWAKWLSC